MGRPEICVSLLLFFASMAICCPPAENIAPFCTCRVISGDNMMFCNELLSPDELISPMKSVVMNNIKLFSLSIVKSSLLYIPDNIFQDTHLEKIRFVESEIMSLSDSDEAFSGLEDTLTEIRATEAHYIAQWNWQQIRNLKKMELIDVNWITLNSIDEPFPELSKLTALGIIRAEISFIVDSAFANLPKLTIFNMKENQISELKRSMFPNPATHLYVMDLSGNEISHLPGDMFDNMPSLSQLHLDRNKFVTLTENPFLQARRGIQEITMSGNPFRCDCRMRWLVGAVLRGTFTAVCTSPESLNGTRIRDLDFKSLWCY